MKKCEEFIIREITGDYVMMPIGETALKFNGLIMANAVSAFIWEKIEEVDTVEELAKLITDEFEVTYEQAFEDCNTLIQQMIKSNWIKA